MLLLDKVDKVDNIIVRGIMKTLGDVRQEVDSERYGLSMKMFELGAKALQCPDLIDIAKPHMQQLSDATGETVHLGLLIDSEIICVHKVDSCHMLGMHSRVGRRAPLHCTATGKVLLAWENPARRTAILKGCDFKRFAKRPSPRLRTSTSNSNARWHRALARTAKSLTTTSAAPPSPLFDRMPQVVAGLSVSFPTFRYNTAREPELVAVLREASRDLSRQLGCTAFPLGAPESTRSTR